MVTGDTDSESGEVKSDLELATMSQDYASCTKGTGSLQATKPRVTRLEVNSTPWVRRLAVWCPGGLEEMIAAEVQRTLSCGGLAALVVKRGEERSGSWRGKAGVIVPCLPRVTLYFCINT